MKKASILACSLLFVSIAGFGQTQSQPPLSREALAAILGLPAAGSCAAQPSAVRHGAKRPGIPAGKSLCTATATCEFGLTVTCSSNVSASSCSAVDASCPDQAGSVTCDGVTTSCQPCCTGQTDREIACCECNRNFDCVACCQCQGHTLGYCSRNC